MIVDDYAAIAKRLKELQYAEVQPVKSSRDLDDEIADFLIGNDEETGLGYPEHHDIYIGC